MDRLPEHAEEILKKHGIGVPIEGYENYLIFKGGFIWSKNKDCIKKPRKNNCGYRVIGLWNEGKVKYYSLHRLIAKHFVPNPDSKLDINHKDGNKDNNLASNLEWCTHSENMLHHYKGKRKSNYPYLTYNDKTSKWVARPRINNVPTYLGYFEDEDEAHRAILEAVRKINETN